MQSDNQISLASLINICEKSPYSLKELQGLVIDWAKEKDIESEKQYLKIMEEYGELCGAILKLEKKGIEPLIDAIGDVMVTLTIQLELLDKLQFLEVWKSDTRTGNIFGLHKKFTENYFANNYYACAEIIQSIAHLYNLNPVDCLWYAYQIISKRKGVSVNGTFIKETEIKNEIPEPEID